MALTERGQIQLGDELWLNEIIGLHDTYNETSSEGYLKCMQLMLEERFPALKKPALQNFYDFFDIGVTLDDHLCACTLAEMKVLWTEDVDGLTVALLRDIGQCLRLSGVSIFLIFALEYVRCCAEIVARNPSPQLSEEQARMLGGLAALWLDDKGHRSPYHPSAFMLQDAEARSKLATALAEGAMNGLNEAKDGYGVHSERLSLSAAEARYRSASDNRTKNEMSNLILRYAISEDPEPFLAMRSHFDTVAEYYATCAAQIRRATGNETVYEYPVEDIDGSDLDDDDEMFTGANRIIRRHSKTRDRLAQMEESLKGQWDIRL